ncbi:hypothetical protein M6B38_398615 [Iris pallida]|uniref:Uncharacterized protein n=1 Tax=Iris pallida TaxID=29817 RepID=A0AAX6FV97_IRIPA|nr:hypothetical protein M6B38_398615 [Iris pallida]
MLGSRPATGGQKEECGSRKTWLPGTLDDRAVEGLQRRGDAHGASRNEEIRRRSRLTVAPAVSWRRGDTRGTPREEEVRRSGKHCAQKSFAGRRRARGWTQMQRSLVTATSPRRSGGETEIAYPDFYGPQAGPLLETTPEASQD